MATLCEESDFDSKVGIPGMDQLDVEDSGLVALPGEWGRICLVEARRTATHDVKIWHGNSAASYYVTCSKDVSYKFVAIESVLKTATGKGLSVICRGSLDLKVMSSRRSTTTTLRDVLNLPDIAYHLTRGYSSSPPSPTEVSPFKLLQCLRIVLCLWRPKHINARGLKEAL